ncbi:MAG: hypothetical protein WA981_10000 [Glaciecola sp.]
MGTLRKSQASKNGINPKLLVVCAIIAPCSSGVFAGDLTARAGVEVEYVSQTIKPQNDDEIDVNNQIATPYAAMVYQAKKLNAEARASLESVRRQLDDATVTKDYTSYQVRTRYQIVQNKLVLSANGSQSFRAPDSQTYLTNDFLLNAETLIKTESRDASLSLNLPANDYIGITSSFGVDRIRSSSVNETNAQGLGNSDRESGSVRITSGKALQPINYELSASYSDIDRRDQRDFLSELASFKVNTQLYSGFALTFLGSYENNQTNQDNTALDALRTYYSLGAGITWSKSQNRFIEIAINEYRTKAALETQDDERDQFISASVNWQFSDRTRFTGSYSRRFFGESANVNFSHSLRTWRNSIRYNETVTAASRLNQTLVPSVFVCDAGSIDLSDCNLPTGLEPELEEGQTLIPGFTPVFDFSDDITISKTLNYSSSLQRRRTRLILSLSNSENEFVERQQINDTSSLQLSAIFTISPRSSLSLRTQASKTTIENIVDDSEDGNDTLETTSEGFNRTSTLSFNRKLTRRLDAIVSYTYTKRTGNLQTQGNFGGIDGPFDDRRISASIKYTFTSR